MVRPRRIVVPLLCRQAQWPQEKGLTIPAWDTEPVVPFPPSGTALKAARPEDVKCAVTLSAWKADCTPARW
jgi:hypothetical protein